jgi:hypothetical protein
MWAASPLPFAGVLTPSCPAQRCAAQSTRRRHQDTDDRLALLAQLDGELRVAPGLLLGGGRRAPFHRAPG